MIFQTQNQIYCFFIFIFFGIILGLISILFFSFTLIKFQKNLIKTIFLTIFYSIFAIFFVILLNFFNFGKFNIVPLFAYIIGFLWIKQLLKNLLVIFQNKWYNIFNKFLTKFKKSRKQKTNELKKN